MPYSENYGLADASYLSRYCCPKTEYLVSGLAKPIYKLDNKLEYNKLYSALRLNVATGLIDSTFKDSTANSLILLISKVNHSSIQCCKSVSD